MRFFGMVAIAKQVIHIFNMFFSTQSRYIFILLVLGLVPSFTPGITT